MARQEGSLRKEKFLIDESVDEGASGGLRYEIGVPLGSIFAGKDLAVTITVTTTADEYPKIKLAGSYDPIVGRLESIESDGYASIAVGGDRMYFAKGGTPTVGRGILGYSNTEADRGKVMSIDVTGLTPGLTSESAVDKALNARGIILMVNISNDPDVLQVLLP